MNKKKTKLHLESYSDKYRDSLKSLLVGLSVELFDELADDDPHVDSFVESHWAIYLLMDGEKVVGFTSYTYNSFYGMRSEPTISNDFLFVEESYRGGIRSMYQFSMQTGRIIKETGLALEHYYATGHSMKLSKRLKGEVSYTSVIYKADEVIREYELLRKRFDR